MTTLVGYFDSPSDSEHALQELANQGIPRMAITTISPEAADHTAAWSHLLGAGLDADRSYSYAEGVRRGGSLVAVQADLSTEEVIRQAFAHSGAVDIETRSQEWLSEGWQPYDASMPLPEPSPDAAPPAEPAAELPADEQVGPTIGALTGGAVAGGYGAAGETIFGNDQPPERD